MDAAVATEMTPHQLAAFTQPEVEQWIASRFAHELRRDAETIPKDQPITLLGIDSVQILCVMTQIEDGGGFRFAENPLEQCSTIEELAAYVTGLIQDHAS